MHDPVDVLHCELAIEREAEDARRHPMCNGKADGRRRGKVAIALVLGAQRMEVLARDDVLRTQGHVKLIATQAEAFRVDLVPRAVPADSPIMIAPGARAQIPTGIALALPPGFEGQVRPRSGLAARHGITVLNTPGTVDADYRGEVMVILINFGHESFNVARGMRIAQMIIAATMQAKICEVASLDLTDRGTGGFGSTGIMVPK